MRLIRQALEEVRDQEDFQEPLFPLFKCPGSEAEADSIKHQFQPDPLPEEKEESEGGSEEEEEV